MFRYIGARGWSSYTQIKGAVRWMCDAATNAGETRLAEILKQRFPQATGVEVRDISGGCGAMYEVWVEAPDFKGLSRVKQHKLITQTLKSEIQDMHGLRISTTVPEES